jgi:hypothetical protein
LRVVTEKTIGRIRAWHKVTQGRDAELPSASAFGFADDSLQMISAAAYERFVLPHHERLYSTMTTGDRALHLCGYSSQHYGLLRRKLNVTSIDGPGPFVDHAHYLQAFGPGFSFSAQMNHSVLERGRAGDIQAMLEKLLGPGAKVPGRFQVMGFVTRDTPLENIRACYEAGRRLGTIRNQQSCDYSPVGRELDSRPAFASLVGPARMGRESNSIPTGE